MFASRRLDLVLLVGCAVLICVVPRFQAPRLERSLELTEKPMMRSWIARTGLVAGLLLNPMNAENHAVVADDDKAPAERPATEPSSLPDELKQFNGMLLGQLVERDVERGTFAVKVDYVVRVWENSQARNPRAAVGKTLRVNGVTGKWLDQLLLVRPGETIEFEAQHRGGDMLTFPGEWLKKAPPFKSEEHPVPPDGFRGFAGVITGQVVRKNLESHDLIMRVDAVEKTFDRSRAENADSVLGKPIVVAGFWGKLSQPLEKLKAGDKIRAGVQHRVPKSDHFTVAEFVEAVTESERAEPAKRDSADRAAPIVKSKPKSKDADGAFPAGMQGFRGILRGQLVSRDVEKGELVFRAERVTRTWPENRASDTESCRAREFLVKRIAGKWLDVLVTLKPGDSIEVEAFHNGGQHLDFVSEWLKKVE